MFGELPYTWASAAGGRTIELPPAGGVTVIVVGGDVLVPLLFETVSFAW